MKFHFKQLNHDDNFYFYRIFCSVPIGHLVRSIYQQTIQETMPIRIQRKRTKGWKMPENTVSVCRPTKWGNPFKNLGNEIFMKSNLNGKYSWILICEGDIKYVVWLYGLLFKDNQQWLNYESLYPHHLLFEYWHNHFSRLDLNELTGKNIACFCRIGVPCHGDFLLEKTKIVSYKVYDNEITTNLPHV